jgi:carboxypeptidase T
MKKLVTLFLFFALTLSLAAQERVIIRMESPQPSDVKHFSENNYDIASYRPGGYLDLVVTQDEFERIVSEGFRFAIFQTEAEMAANLATLEDIPGYRTYAVALAEMQQMVIDHPNLCMLYDLGDSRGKEYYDAGNTNYVNYQHDIWALKLTSNVQVYEDKPAIYYMGAHHAREPLSTEVTFYVLNHLLDNYGTDPDITHSINTKEIWFVPIVNPDGHKIVLDQINVNWRKNIRDNDGNGQITPGGGWSFPDGVDPNRNYSWEWGGQGASASPGDQTYRGPSAFSEPEVDAMRELMAYRPFVAGISYHTYSELVLWPFGYANNIYAPDATAISALGTAMAQTIPKLSGSGHYDPGPSWSLYPAAGNTDDYAYGQHGIFSYTIELATQFIPPATQVVQVCQDNLEAALILLNRIDKSTLTGHVTNSVTGEAVVAEVYVHGIDNTGEYREPYKSNEDFGRYFRMLPDGNYSVTFSAFGYISQTIPGVNINNLGQTVLDVELVQSQVISVSGTVTDIDTGAPIENASIQVLGTPLDPVYTNEQGEYLIEEIYENTYTFRVWAMDYITEMQEITISPENNVVNFQLTEANAESFESGEFGAGWTFSGNLPWVIDNSTAWDGMYSARSGGITHNQSTSMLYTAETDSPGMIYFYRKVSSESNYDFLRFYINDELQGQWSGNLDWEEVSFDVMPGYNTFRWTYMKDGSVSSGEDCGWIDFIIFPLPADCSGPVNLTASSVTSNSAQLNWVPGGDETMWDLVWGESGFDPSTQGTLVEGLTEATYALSGLQGVTDYQFYARSYCDDNQMSVWAGPANFTTLCDIFELPYFEPFGTTAVTCWSFPEGQGNWNFGTSYTPPSSTSGAPNAFFNWSPSQTNYSYSLTSPLMDGTGMSEVKLDFILFVNSFSSSTVESMAVEFKALDDTEWTLLELFSTEGLGSGNAEHVRTDQILAGMAGHQFQVRFRAHGPNSYNINGWGLDDIHVHGEGSVILPGDANCDGMVNVIDVITTVNYVMGLNPEPFCPENADVTEDGIINVLDVIATVSIILSK